jgi:sigma-B regulation protein RsbU (phosphoserine phosphatase)
VRKQLGAANSRYKQLTSRVRAWLRRVMPGVAIAAAVLFILRMLFRETWLFGENVVGIILELVWSCAIFFTVIYYGLKALLWLKRRLLWRVRRRLVVTYLFVGLTPIVLLALLGMLSAFGGSSQAMSRIIISQLNATERQTQASARELADGFARLPPNTDDRAAQAWLEERATMLRAALPGARIVAWRGAPGEEATTGQQSRAQFVSDLADENTRGVGSNQPPLDSQLPDWLRGRSEWSGFTFISPNDEKERFAAPSVRAMARSTVEGRAVTLLLVVPISRALVQEYRERTGIYLRPFFMSRGVMIKNDGTRIDVGGGDFGSAENSEQAERARGAFSKDQFGEPMNQTVYVVVGPATNWANGTSGPHLLFMFDWSWAVASKQFLEGSALGTFWQQALKAVSIAFLVLELLALVAAAWMTRAVTGTVHKLYRATEYIKRGDFSHRVHARSRDQLGELATAFNEMSSNIETLLEERVVHERLEREVEIAAEVQARLFPGRVPELLSVEIAAECRAARGVAGDYYDYIEVVPGLVALALGDVSGKGVSASLVMSNLQASLRAQAAITAERLSMAERAVAVSAGDGSKVLARVMADADIEGAVARKVTNINKQLCQSTEGNRFATLFLALYEDRTRTLRYCNAGHNAALLVKKDGTAESLTRGGMMVGAFDWAEYEEARTTLEPGDLLLIFSDGLSEAENEKGEEYGEERIAKFTIEHRTLSAHDLRLALFDEIDAWSGERERGDDQTLLIVKAND